MFFNSCSMFFLQFNHCFLCFSMLQRWHGNDPSLWSDFKSSNDYGARAVQYCILKCLLESEFKCKISIVISVHSTNGRFPQTPLPEVNHRALTCVLQLYERQATKFPGMEKQGYSRLLAWGAKRRKDSVKSDYCFNSFLFHRICSGSCEREKSSMEMRYYRKRKHFCFSPLNGKQFGEGAKS